MPFKISKVGDKYVIKKGDKTINKKFNTKESAIKTATNWMKYRGETNIKVIGNRITRTKKK